MRTAVAKGADVAVRSLRESPTQGEDTSVQGVGGCILLGRRNRTLEDHTWWEEPCGSFREEMEKKIERNRKNKDKRCKHRKMQVNKRMRK